MHSSLHVLDRVSNGSSKKIERCRFDSSLPRTSCGTFVVLWCRSVRAGRSKLICTNLGDRMLKNDEQENEQERQKNTEYKKDEQKKARKQWQKDKVDAKKDGSSAQLNKMADEPLQDARKISPLLLRV